MGALSLKLIVTGVAVVTYGRAIARDVDKKAATAVAVDVRMAEDGKEGMSLAPAKVAPTVRPAKLAT